MRRCSLRLLSPEATIDPHAARTRAMDWAILSVSIAALIATVVLGLWSLGLARRAEDRATMRADVGWQLERIEPGAFKLTNVGRDPALSARWILGVDDETLTREADRVDPSTSLVLNSVNAAEAHHREKNAREEYETATQLQYRDAALIPTLTLRPPPPRSIHVVARVTWVSGSGTWHQRVITQEPWPAEF